MGMYEYGKGEVVTVGIIPPQQPLAMEFVDGFLFMP